MSPTVSRTSLASAPPRVAQRPQRFEMKGLVGEEPASPKQASGPATAASFCAASAAAVPPLTNRQFGSGIWIRFHFSHGIHFSPSPSLLVLFLKLRFGAWPSVYRSMPNAVHWFLLTFPKAREGPITALCGNSNVAARQTPIRRRGGSSGTPSACGPCLAAHKLVAYLLPSLVPAAFAA